MSGRRGVVTSEDLSVLVGGMVAASLSKPMAVEIRAAVAGAARPVAGRRRAASGRSRA